MGIVIVPLGPLDVVDKMVSIAVFKGDFAFSIANRKPTIDRFYGFAMN